MRARTGIFEESTRGEHARVLCWTKQAQLGDYIIGATFGSWLKGRPDSMDRPNILLAKENEVDLVLEILNEAAEWLGSMGLPSRWRLVNLARENFLDRTRRGEVFLAKLGGETVGTITLQWSDPIFWKDALPR